MRSAVASSTSTRDAIVTYLEKHGAATSTDLVEHLRITRQAINLQIRALINAGQVVKTGSTRRARYFPASAAPQPAVFARPFDLVGLDEADVYERVATTLNLVRQLRPNVASIAHYAFTEMLNNAIEHSKADRCRVHMRLEASQLAFEVSEAGIGVFGSIANKLQLTDEQAAMIELLKGKTTTMPETHSGEGLFFTARSADRMVLNSRGIQVEWSRAHDDIFVSTPRFRQGTQVIFEIRRDSRTRLEDVFAEFAPAAYDFQFQKTRILVKLLQRDYVARSEAKRLLLNLEKFSEVELDMRGVKQLGQGFADEVFRVFASNYPHVQVRAINATDNIAAMIQHVCRCNRV